MLSIIISSYQEKYYTALEKNIAETIGIPYEIIKIENPGLMGICEAYNIGASKAKFDYLLFIHEDILFRTNNWGDKLISHLRKKKTGIIGLAGSNYVPAAPSSWSVSNSKYKFGNVNSHLSDFEIQKFPQKVFALDGVFLAIRKNVFNEYLFDENIEGFHGYDTDFSLRVAIEYDNYVIWDVFINHFSKGNLDKKWLDNHIQIKEKVKYNFNNVFDENQEIVMFHFFLRIFFGYYKCNLNNILLTKKFIPKKISWYNKYLILKSYIYYLINNNLKETINES